MAAMPGEENLLVVVDQFEELFRFHQRNATAKQRDKAEAFVNLLLEGARDENYAIHVVLTMRSGFFGECAAIEGLSEVIRERMKMKRDHLVPLPTQALKVLTELKEIDLGSPLVFPAPRDLRRMLSEMTFNAALRRMGYSGDVHVHHGFRTTASTNLNEMGWNADWIERRFSLQ